MKRLIEKLIADLSAERILTHQVVRSLLDRCEISSNEVADFLNGKAGEVDETTLDAVLSPIYTPDWTHRAHYVEDMERVEVTTQTVSLIVSELVQAGIQATYQYEDGTVTMPLPEVMIDRWVRRLHLDAAIPDRVRAAIDATVPNGDQAMIKAMAGHSAWGQAKREEILIAYLTGVAQNGQFSVPKFECLTGLMQTYRPKDMDHFMRQLDTLVQSYQEDKSEQFFDSHLKEAYGHTGSTDLSQNSHAETRQQQMTLATRIQQDLSAYATSSP